jgi:hypothetical protein
MNPPRNLKQLFLFIIFIGFFVAAHTQPATVAGNRYTDFSTRLLLAVKKKQPTDVLFQQLAAFDKDSLATALSNDTLRKTFWLNVYNATTQESLRKDSSLILQQAAYPEKDLVKVAGRMLSPDFILHRILRRSKNKYGLGYFNKIFTSDYEKQMRVDFVDYRVHFAVNNGAASCGAIDVYDANRLDDQLNWSTIYFLQQEIKYDSTAKAVSLPKILDWYRADFGGEKGLVQLLQKLLIIPANRKTTLRYRDFDWTLRLGRFR